MTARELDRSEAVSFYSDVLPVYLGRMPRLAQPMLRTFIGRSRPRCSATRPAPPPLARSSSFVAQNGPDA